MRVFGLGLLVALSLSFASAAQAGRVIDGPSLTQDTSPNIAVEIEQDIALGNLVSPSMQWSQLEMDSLKAEGLNSSLPYAYTAELAVKSDLIRSFNVAQIKQLAPPPNQRKYRSLVGLLMLTAGFTMWFGLTLQRKY